MNAHVPHKAELPFNRTIFRWARERRQMDVEEAAERIGTIPEKLDEWERGDAVPTVRQARVLADVYGRAFLDDGGWDAVSYLGHAVDKDEAKFEEAVRKIAPKPAEKPEAE